MFYIKSSLKTDEQQEEQKSPTTYSIYVLSGKKNASRCPFKATLGKDFSGLSHI